MAQRTHLSRPRTEKTSPKHQKSFWGELLAFMAKQCIVSAMIFSILYFFKNSGLPFLGNIFSFVKNAVNSPLVPPSIFGFFG